MAVDNKTLQIFFNKQKRPRIDALISLTTPKKIKGSVINKSVSNKYQTGTKLVPNRYQSDTKTGFFSLTGLQKEIAITIYKLCQISRDKKTDAVSINQLANQCKSTNGAVKTAVHRLINKNILLRENFKNGRGGWTVYSIPNVIYQEIFNLETQSKLVPNWYQTGNQTGVRSDTKRP